MAFYLQKPESVSSGLKRIAREQINIVIDDLEDKTLGDSKKVHGYRARCKKMRGLLRLAGPVMGDAFTREDARFRDAGKHLRKIRDSQVHAETLASLQYELGSEPAVPAADFELEPAVLDISLQEMRDALSAVDDWQLNVQGFYDITPGIANTYVKGRRAFRSALNEPSDERYHRLRKWTKYLWYQTRILERMNRKVLNKRRMRLRKIHQSLGRAHDLVMLAEILCLQSDADEDVLRRAQRQKEKLYETALENSRQVFTASPERYTADMAEWWADWRA